MKREEHCMEALRAGPWRKRLRGFILGFTLMMIPICLLIAFTLCELTLNENRFSYHTQVRGKEFYLAETGLNIAYYCFGNNNYSSFTHSGSPTVSTEIASGNSNHLAVTYTTAGTNNMGASGGFTEDTDGWYKWTYTPGTDPAKKSLTQTGLPELIRVAVWYTDSVNHPGQFEIDAQATLGTAGLGGQSTEHSLIGYTQTPLMYAAWSAGDYGEIARGQTQIFNGDIFANGALYINPHEAAATIYANKVWSANNIIRSTDPWGYTVHSNAYISNSSSSGALVTWAWATQYSAFDSQQSSGAFDGSNTATNAKGTFGGVVMDGSMGVQSQSAPKLGNFQPGGYYQQNANVVISSSGASVGGTAISSTAFLTSTPLWNAAEGTTNGGMSETVQKLNIATLMQNTTVNPNYGSSTGYNLVIYSDTPTVITNAEVLRDPKTGVPVNLTFASDAPVYTVGSVDRADMNGGSVDANTPPTTNAAIMTSDRIYTLSYNFNYTSDVTNTTADVGNVSWSTYTAAASVFGSAAWVNAHNLNESGTSATFYNSSGTPTSALNTSTDPDVSNSLMEQNFAYVDGIPTVIEDGAAQGGIDPNTGLARTNPTWPGDTTTAPSGSPTGHNDLELEDLSALTLRRWGSMIHLQNATMALFNNSSAGAQAGGYWNSYWETGNGFYQHPTRDYRYNTNFQNSAPPLVPLSALKYCWIERY